MSAEEPLRIVILGLSITSSWGNGHATTFRGLMRELCARGHDVLFLERDQPWYAGNRDLPQPPYGRTVLYGSLEELRERFQTDVRQAEAVIVGSYVPQGVAVGEWVCGVAGGITAFYDIDTPITMARLAEGGADYLVPALVPRYDLYLSFTGGPTLRRIEKRYGARRARPLYCSCDPQAYVPRQLPDRWELGYLGTYSADRQPRLQRLLLDPAARRPQVRFAVAGPQYPEELQWPDNVDRFQHLAPAEHPDFYGAQRYTLNITRSDMVAAGWSPSVRLFEAAACATAIISDYWPGLEAFFVPGREVLVAHSCADTLHYLDEVPEEERRAIGGRARERVLAAHTAAHRAAELESYVREAWPTRSSRRGSARAASRAAPQLP